MSIARFQSNPNPPNVVITKSVVVPKPDGYTTTGTGVVTPLGSDCRIAFKLSSGGNPATDYVGGFAQEKITNNVVYDRFGNAFPQRDGDWVPTDGSDPLAGRFAIDTQTASIIDLKRFDTTDMQSYSGTINGSKLQTLNQQMRIKFTYPGGVVDYAILPSVNFTFSKSDDGSYQID